MKKTLVMIQEVQKNKKEEGVNEMNLKQQLTWNGRKVKTRKEKVELLTKAMVEVAKLEILTNYMDKVCLSMNLECTVVGLLYEYESLEEFLYYADVEVDRIDETMAEVLKDSMSRLKETFKTYGVSEMDEQVKLITELKIELKRSLKSIKAEAIGVAITELDNEGIEVLVVDNMSHNEGYSAYVTAIYDEDEMKEIIWEDIFETY